MGRVDFNQLRPAVDPNQAAVTPDIDQLCSASDGFRYPLTEQFFFLYLLLAWQRRLPNAPDEGYVGCDLIRRLPYWDKNSLASVGKQIQRDDGKLKRIDEAPAPFGGLKRQYRFFSRKYPSSILFFQAGRFYEFYERQAEIAPRAGRRHGAEFRRPASRFGAAARPGHSSLASA